MRERQLRRWVDAGLISDEQQQRIIAFESSRSRPTLLYAVGGLGGLAIAIGLLSIVASNWDAIPGWSKLGIDVLLVAALGYLIVWLRREGPAWALETALVVHYGLVLASIALIGQVYQLGGELHIALAVWTLLSALLMAHGRSAVVALCWLAGLQLTGLAWVVWLAEDHGPLALAAAYWIPLAALAVGRSERVRAQRPVLAGVFESIAWLELVSAASIGTFAFYGETSEELGGLLVGVALSAAGSAWLSVRTPGDPRGRSTVALLAACLCFTYVPLLISPGDMGVLAALSFIALWLVVAVAAHRGRHYRALNVATALIGLRLLAVYFEVFGDLLDTGLALVSGGLLTIGLTWLWARKRKEFARDQEDLA